MNVADAIFCRVLVLVRIVPASREKKDTVCVCVTEYFAPGFLGEYGHYENWGGNMNNYGNEQ